MGVFIQEAEIGLPATFVKQSTSASANGNMPALNPTRKIVGRNLLIGTGGFSGTVGLETNVAGAIPFNIGNFEIAITDFGLNFHMNKLLNSTISAKLNIPALTNGSQPTTVDVAVFIQNTDNFKVTGNFKTNPITINCFDVFDFDITTLTYEEIDNRKALGLSGILSFKNNLAGLGDLLPKNIAIEKLIIYDDGDIDFKLGAIPLPPFNLKLGVVEVGVHGLSYTVTKLGTRKYGVISFDGNVNSGVGGFDGQANGVKLYFSIDSGATDIFLRVESIRVSIKIPSNATPEQARVLIDGFISVRNTSEAPNAPTEYGGGISIALNDLGIAAGAAIKMTPSIPSFIVDLSLELSVPIPLGPTGLGLYGFRGLIGNNYHVNREEEENWWQFYKRKDPSREGINIEGNKFEGNTGFNLGAGTTIGTLGDSGYTVNSKVFVMLGLPRLLLLQGQTAVLKKRLGLNDPQDPPFVSFMAIDEESVSSGMGINYLAPAEGEDAGSIFNMQGLSQMAFFYKDSSAWYVNFGKDKPVEERMRANLFNLIDAYAYLMISAKGIKAGAGASMGIKKDVGPVKIGASVSMAAGGQISFKPFQMGGFMEIAGEAYVRVYKFGIGLGMRTMLVVEGPKPFIIKGLFEVSIGLPWPFDDINLSVDLEWKRSNRTTPDLSPIPIIDASKSIPVSAFSMHTQESFPVLFQEDQINLTNINWDNYTVPMDSYIDIDFAQTPKFTLGEDSNIKINGNLDGSDDYFFSPPVKSYSDKVKHAFIIDNIVVKYLSQTNTLAKYNIWEQVANHLNLLPSEDENTLPLTVAQLLALPNASIQQVLPGSRKTNKLRILAQDMFNYVNQTSPGSIKLESFNVDAKTIFCSKKGNVTKTINWENEEIGTELSQNVVATLDDNISLIVKDATPEVVSKTDGYNNMQQGLKVNTKEGIELNFDSSLSTISIKLSIDNLESYSQPYNQGPRTAEARDTILLAKFYKKTQTGTDPDGYPVYSFVKVGYKVFQPLDPNNNLTTLTYTAPTGVVFDKAVITCFSDAISSPSATGIMIIGNGCFNKDEAFNGTIAEVQLWGRQPYNHVSTNNFEKIGEWRLNSTVANTALVNNSNYTYDSIQATGGDNLLGIHTDSLKGYLLGFGGTDPIWGTSYYTFTASGHGVRIPSNMYTFDPNYQGFPAYYFPGTIDTIWTEDRWELTGQPLANYQKIFSDKRLFLMAVIKTSDTSKSKRVIVDKRVKVMWPDEYEFGFTMYLLDERLHIDIVYGERFTYRCNDYVLTDGGAHQITFDYHPQTFTLSVWINSVKVADNIAVTDFTNYRIRKPKDIILQEISYQTYEDVLYDATLPSAADLQSEIKSVEDGLRKSIQPIWRPDTNYVIEIKGKHQINNSIIHNQTYHVLFRTKGPVGFIHQYKEDYSNSSEQFKLHTKYIANNQTTDEIKLAHLKYYIDKEVSRPDVDGNLIYVKPLYRSNPAIKLYYQTGYMKLLYANWPEIGAVLPDSTYLPASNYSLRCSIIDPETKQEVSSDLIWKVSKYMKETPSLELWNKLISEGFNCVTTGGTIRQLSYNAEFTINQVLRPEKIYELNLFAVNHTAVSDIEQKVHTLTFKTSKYLDFDEQLSTYNLLETQKAFFDKEVTLGTLKTQQLTDLLTSTRGVAELPEVTPELTVELKQILPSYNSKFDLLIDVILTDFSTLNKPMTTEVIKITDVTTDEVTSLITKTVVGLLLRSDESLFDPLLEDVYLYGSTINTPSIELKDNNGDLIPTKLIFAKDCASVFIAVNSFITGSKIILNTYEFNPETNTKTIITTKLIQL